MYASFVSFNFFICMLNRFTSSFTKNGLFVSVVVCQFPRSNEFDNWKKKKNNWKKYKRTSKLFQRFQRLILQEVIFAAGYFQFLQRNTLDK